MKAGDLQRHATALELCDIRARPCRAVAQLAASISLRVNEGSVMAGRVERLGIVAAMGLAIGLAACSVAPGNSSTRLHEEARADLTRWADAVEAAGGPSRFVPVGELTGQLGDWEESVGNNNKRALGAGMVEAGTSLPAETPPDGEVRWPDGTTRNAGLISGQEALSRLKADGANDCPDCTPLKITGAQLASGQMQTSRGPAQVPVWEFTLDGTAVRITRLAVADYIQVKPPTWDPNNAPVGISIESATETVDGRQLTVSFVGAPSSGDQPCGADYTTEPVESELAVVVIVFEHSNGAPVPCTAVGALRTATVQLSAALADRTVLEVRQGLPVAVLPTP
jgi:hypothetical protein